MTEIETIAKGLDRTRRKALFSETQRGDFSTKSMNILLKHGLIFKEDWHITPLGQAVRDYLKGQPC